VLLGPLSPVRKALPSTIGAERDQCGAGSASWLIYARESQVCGGRGGSGEKKKGSETCAGNFPTCSLTLLHQRWRDSVSSWRRCLADHWGKGRQLEEKGSEQFYFPRALLHRHWTRCVSRRRRTADLYAQEAECVGAEGEAAEKNSLISVRKTLPSCQHGGTRCRSWKRC
jgi:hypothetical protein